MGGITPGLGNASMWFTPAPPDDGDELLGVAFENLLLLEAAAAVEAAADEADEAATAAAAVLYPLADPA